MKIIGRLLYGLWIRACSRMCQAIKSHFRFLCLALLYYIPSSHPLPTTPIVGLGSCLVILISVHNPTVDGLSHSCYLHCTSFLQISIPNVNLYISLYHEFQQIQPNSLHQYIRKRPYVI